MKNNQTQTEFELISNYLKGELDSQDTIDFEKRMASDESLREEVEKTRLEISLIKEYGLRAQLNSIHKDLYEKKTTTLNTSWQFISGIAASVVLIIGVWFFVDSNQATSGEIFSQNFRPYPNLISVRNDDADSSQWMLAMQYYSAGEYDQCLGLLTEKNYPDHLAQDIQFYQAICLIATNKYNQAIQDLEKLRTLGSKYDQQIRWYMGLSHVGLGQSQEATRELEKIQPDQYGYKKASIIIESLGN